jgi:hypothetical protein
MSAALLIFHLGLFNQAAAQGLTQQPATPMQPGANQGAVQGASGGVTGGIGGAKNGLIDIDKVARLRAYILNAQPKSSAYDEPVHVGGILPEQGVYYYDVPPDYGSTPYRVAVIGGDPVLVDPHTRAIKQLIK